MCQWIILNMYKLYLYSNLNISILQTSTSPCGMTSSYWTLFIVVITVIHISRSVPTIFYIFVYLFFLIVIFIYFVILFSFWCCLNFIWIGSLFFSIFRNSLWPPLFIFIWKVLYLKLLLIYFIFFISIKLALHSIEIRLFWYFPHVPFILSFLLYLSNIWCPRVPKMSTLIYFDQRVILNWNKLCWLSIFDLFFLKLNLLWIVEFIELLLRHTQNAQYFFPNINPNIGNPIILPIELNRVLYHVI